MSFFMDGLIIVSQKKMRQTVKSIAPTLGIINVNGTVVTSNLDKANIMSISQLLVKNWPTNCRVLT